VNAPYGERGDARMTGTVPYSTVNIPEVMARNSAARDIVAGFASATPTLAAAWRHVGAALADCAALAADVARLAEELRTARLERANLAAAMRATLAADSDGETDPLVVPARRAERDSQHPSDAFRRQRCPLTVRCVGSPVRSAVAACNPCS
jgi:hypothetical protein